MRVAVIDVTPLERARVTFKPAWRFYVALGVLLCIVEVWASIQESNLAPLFGDPRLRTGARVALVLAVIAICLAFRRQGIIAQLLFTGLAAFGALLILGIVFNAVAKSSVEPLTLWPMVVAGLLACWGILSRPAVASLQTLVPLRRWRAHRQRLALSKRLWSGEWKDAGAPPGDAGTGERLRPGCTLYLRLAWGWLALGFAMACWWLASAAGSDLSLADAIYRLDFRELAQLLQTGPPEYDNGFPLIHRVNLALGALFLAGLLGLRGFSAAWMHWRRRNVPVRRAAMQMTTSSVLLLRSFREEEKGVPGRFLSLRAILTIMYGRGYTFVDMVVERLAAVGPVKLFGSERILPPPRDGDRYFTDQWEDDITRVVPLARMIVVLFGTTDSLAWEMNVVRDGGHLPRTVFLVPWDVFPRRARRRWDALVGFLCPDPEYRRTVTKAIRPRQVLAVCVQRDLLLVFTGRQAHLAYEAALDLAAALTLAGPGAADEVVTKYIDPAR